MLRLICQEPFKGTLPTLPQGTISTFSRYVDSGAGTAIQDDDAVTILLFLSVTEHFYDG